MPLFPSRLWMLSVFAGLLMLNGCGGGSNSQGGSGHSAANESASKFASLNQKILNGSLIDPAALPYVALSVAQESPNLFDLCTGSFITPNQVLLAGHCVVHRDTGLPFAPEEMAVALNGAVAQVVAISLYPNYDGAYQASTLYPGSQTLPKDLAIITIDRVYSGPLGVISSMPPEQNQTLLLVGRGRSDPNQDTDGQLRGGFAAVAAVSTDDKVIYTVFDGVTDSGICHGDSGGPAIAQMPNGPSLAIVGINSTITPGDCSPPNLNQMTLLSDPDYLSWIIETTNNQALIQ